jgi:hypothetical protein
LASPQIIGRSGVARPTRTPSLTIVFSTSKSVSSMTRFKSTRPDWPDGERANDKSPWVMRAMRCECRWMTRRSSVTSSGKLLDSASSSMSSARVEMIPIGLLSSCARPAASVPSAASFSDCLAARSRPRRSVMSSISSTAPAGRPAWRRRLALTFRDVVSRSVSVLDGVQLEAVDLAAQQPL